MAIRKTNLQKHRLNAFTVTLEQLETRLEQKIKFVTDYSEVYKLPKMLTRRNLRQYKRWLQAAKELKEIEQKHL